MRKETPVEEENEKDKIEKNEKKDDKNKDKSKFKRWIIIIVVAILCLLCVLGAVLGAVLGKPKHTVKFMNGDGAISVQSVKDGESAVAPGVPYKAPDAQYTYTFKEWDKTFDKVTGDLIINAVFEKSVNNYTITWDVDGTRTGEVYAYGETPQYKGVTDKPADTLYAYAFDGWTPALETVTSDKTYTARYTQTRQYTVTVTSADGSTLKTIKADGNATLSDSEVLRGHDGYELLSITDASGNASTLSDINKDLSVTIGVASKSLMYRLLPDSDTWEVYNGGDVRGALVVPLKHEGKFVTRIRAKGFQHVALISIFFPASVTEIGDQAFVACRILSSVTIPGTVTRIGAYAFRGCINLTSATIGKGVKSIGQGAFGSCSKLAGIIIPESVTEIGGGAFSGCALTDITIPAGVTTIGTNAFHCKVLTRITVAAGNGAFKDIDGVLFSKDGKTLFRYPIGKEGTSYAIGADVTVIWDYAFDNCAALTAVTIPAGVTVIGESAFSGCALTNITIPAGVTTIGIDAFRLCSALTGITVAAENGAFKDIDGVLYSKDGKTIFKYPEGKEGTSYAIEAGVENMGENAFNRCKLTEITMSEGITNISREAFYECFELTNVTIPASVTSIGDNAFYATKLTSIIYSGTQAEWASIVKGGDWEPRASEYTVHCSDGDIPKP